MTTITFTLPASTPATIAYPNLAIDSTQFKKNNFQPTKRSFLRTLSAQEDEHALKQLLRKYWKHDSFRGPQLDICLASLRGMDLMVVAPTGLGKSVCFQLPAIASEHGITLVVSPLIALMKDQIRSLRAKDIPCGMVYEKSDSAEMKRILQDLVSSHPRRRILYLTPETLFGSRLSKELRVAYQKNEIRRLVIDEAHTIGEWGMTFRPTYRNLGKFREEFPRVPITALTASATEDVRADICNILKIERQKLGQWVEPFNRKNLFYEINYRGGSDERTGRDQDMVDYILRYRAEAKRRNLENGVKSNCVSGIVYCAYKLSCDRLAKVLNEAGVVARPFYAGKAQNELDGARISWQNGQTECIVATIAFGMGIDAPHVRYVIHYDMPQSFEGFYQETGRAGRDGHLSRCLLFYSREEAQYTMERLLRNAPQHARSVNSIMTDEQARDEAKRRCKDSFKWLQNEYAEKAVCRHVQICRYFGEIIDERDPAVKKAYCGGMCDVCADSATVFRNRLAINDEIDTPSQFVRPPKRALPEDTPSSDLPDVSLDLLASTTDASAEATHRSRASRSSRPSIRSAVEVPNSHVPRASDERSPLAAPRPRVPFAIRSYNAPGPSRPRAAARIRNCTSDEGGYAEAAAPPDSEKKRKAQEAAFQGVEPVTDDGPYRYYNQSPLPGRVSFSAKFKTPFKTPILQEKGKGRVGPITLAMRKEELQLLQAHLLKTVKETPFANRLWAVWQGAPDEKRRVVSIKKAAKEMEEAVVVNCGTQEIYRSSMADVRRTFRLLRSEDGVRIIENNELNTHFQKDEAAAWLRILDWHLRA